MMMDVARGREERAAKAREAMVKARDVANSLLAYEPFIEWAGNLMVSVGFFGEGRELTAYQQGARGRIVQEMERLCELADDGDGFLARVFREKVKGKGKAKA